MVYLQLLVRWVSQARLGPAALVDPVPSRSARPASYGTEIRQFHEIRVAGSIGPSEDPDSESYSLGLMPEPTSVVKAPKYGSGSAAVLRQERIPARLGGGASQGLGWDEGGRYLSQTWSSGTVCDKTGLPREVEVQVSRRFRRGDVLELTSAVHPVPLQYPIH